MALYVPLHVRSAYSLGWGTASPAALVERAAAYGHDALALTDRNNLYGAIPFLEACRDWGVRPILGAEVDGPEGTVVLLVRTRAGYADLCRILTARMLDPAFLLVDALAGRPSGRDGLHVLAADAALLARLAPVVYPGTLWGELVGPGRTAADHEAVAAAAGALGVPVVATGAVTTLRRADHGCHATLAAIRENTLVGRLRPRQHAHPEACFKAPAAMVSLFRSHPGALANTRRLAESCAYVPARERWVFPSLDLPDGETPASYLRALCRGGIHRRYLSGGGNGGGGSGSAGPGPSAAGPRPPRRFLARVDARLDRELAVIERLGFTDYFVIVGEIVQFAREQGIATVGRGSGAGALTAYLLGITNVDPIRYGLSFERFLHEKRPDCPDLDIDLCWKRRDDVIDHVYTRYGRDRVAMISTHAAFRPRSAFREAAKAHGIAHATVNRLCRAVPRSLDGGPPGAAGGGVAAAGSPSRLRLAEAVARAPGGREIPFHEPPWPRVFADAEHLLGLPRHLGVHPGGLVIADRPIAEYVPLEEAAKGIVVTQYEMRAIESIGLVKMDLLGNRALSTIQETIELVRTRDGVVLDPDAFPDPDPETAALFRDGETLGVFQMESPGMRNLNRMLATGDLASTIAAVALIRPGPAASGMKERFVRRARGLEPVTHVDPRLAPVLEETYGVPLYEEDVMRVAAVVAGLSLEDGDMLRRAIVDSPEPQRLEIGRVFRREAERRGYAPDVARAVWENLLQFGAFAFCKAHAAGYGVLAYRAGWLKAHHPVEFTAALMNHHAGMYEKRVHLDDAKRRGVCVLLPDVNRSEDGFTVDGDAVRVGLERVRGLGEATRRRLSVERRRRPFASLEDFLGRVPAARPEVEALILAGAFDAVTGSADGRRSRPELLCVAASGWESFRRSRLAAAVRGGDGLFDGTAPRAASWPVPDLPEFSEEERLWLEWDVLGLCVGRHPMAHLRERGLLDGTVFARDAERAVGKRVKVAGMVAARRVVPTRTGQSMQFVTLEDETGLVECTLFPAAYARHRGVVRTLGPYVATGCVEEQYGAPTLTVESLEPGPSPAPGRRAPAVSASGGRASPDAVPETPWPSP